MSRATASIDPQKLVKFGLPYQRSVTHIGTIQPLPSPSSSLRECADFVPLCDARRILWSRYELENSARTATRICKACEAKARALRSAWERAGREG